MPKIERCIKYGVADSRGLAEADAKYIDSAINLNFALRCILSVFRGHPRCGLNFAQRGSSNYLHVVLTILHFASHGVNRWLG